MMSLKGVGKEKSLIRPVVPLRLLGDAAIRWLLVFSVDYSDFPCFWILVEGSCGDRERRLQKTHGFPRRKTEIIV